MLLSFLKNALDRHIRETLPLIEQINEENVLKKPIEDVRPIGEVILHILRSMEYYLRGIVTDQWESLPYRLEDYGSASSIKVLAGEVFERARLYIQKLDSTDLSRIVNTFNRQATLAEILLELIEHSIHHRGQITVYYRLLQIEPTHIPYII